MLQKKSHFIVKNSLLKMNINCACEQSLKLQKIAMKQIIPNHFVDNHKMISATTHTNLKAYVCKGT